jgi:hypothetical protein
MHSCTSRASSRWLTVTLTCFPIFLAACGPGTAIAVNPIVSLSLAPKAPVLPLGSQTTLSVEGLDSSGGPAELSAVAEWVSSDSSKVLIVSGGATVVAEAAALGDATLTASAEGLSASINVQVVSAVSPNVPPSMP